MKPNFSLDVRGVVKHGYLCLNMADELPTEVGSVPMVVEDRLNSDGGQQAPFLFSPHQGGYTSDNPRQ